MNILPTNFEYSPSFIRVIIPGFSFVLSLIIPLSIYLYFNNKILFFQIINLNELILGTLIISTSVVVGVLINSMEGPLFKFLEGYSLRKILPKYIFNKMQTHQYNKCIKLINVRNELVKTTGLKPNLHKDRLYDIIFNYYSIYLYYTYHAKLDEGEITQSLMPTTFGNIFRSIELYPNWKYGMDGVFFWTNLTSTISEPERKDLDFKYAFVNMYAYLCIIFGLNCFVFGIIPVFLIGKIIDIRFFVIALIFLLVSILCYNILLDSAVSYGKSVRSIFDLHRKELLEKFDLKSIGINSTSDEKEIWKRIKDYLYYPTD